MMNTKKTDKKLTKNYFFNLIYQIVAIIIPLITAPYLSRTLLVEGVGKYAFTFSIANFFTIFAALGFSTYGQREIANAKNDKNKMSIIFFEIIIARFISTILSLTINILLSLFLVYKSYSRIMLIWSLLILSTTFDINFLFQGNEDFIKIVSKNLFIKIISIILIFTFVKTENDLWVYVLIYSVSNLIGNLSLWINAKKYINKVKMCDLHPFERMKPAIKLFIPTIATSLYVYLDKAMIGVLSSNADFENGCYEQAEKVVKMATTIIVSLGTVMIPRNSQLVSMNKIDDLKKNINFAINYVWMLGLPMMFGLIAISNNFIPWFLGINFEKSSILMKILSPLTIFMGFGNVFGLQLLVPMKKDNEWTKCIVIGFCSNIFLNILLIPFLGAYGASISTISSEFIVAFGMLLCCKEILSIKQVIKSSFKYFIASVIMFIPISIISYFLTPSILNTLIIIICGFIIYLLVIITLKDNYIFPLFKIIINKLKEKVKK